MAILSINNEKKYQNLAMYITLAPCIDCLKELLFIGCTNIFYLNTFGTNNKISESKLRIYKKLIDIYKIKIINISNNLDLIEDIKRNYKITIEGD